MLFFFSGDDKSAYKRQRASIVQSSPEGEPSQLLRYLHKPRWEGGKHNPKESNTKYWRKGIHALSCRVTALKCKFNNYIARKQGEWKITKCLLNPSKGEIINEFQWSFIKSSFSLAECWLPAPKCSTLLVAFSPLCTDNFTWFAVASRKSLFYQNCTRGGRCPGLLQCLRFKHLNKLQNINPGWCLPCPPPGSFCQLKYSKVPRRLPHLGEQYMP